MGRNVSVCRTMLFLDGQMGTNGLMSLLEYLEMVRFRVEHLSIGTVHYCAMFPPSVQDFSVCPPFVSLLIMCDNNYGRTSN